MYSFRDGTSGIILSLRAVRDFRLTTPLSQAFFHSCPIHESLHRDNADLAEDPNPIEA